MGGWTFWTIRASLLQLPSLRLSPDSNSYRQVTRLEVGFCAQFRADVLLGGIASSLIVCGAKRTAVDVTLNVCTKSAASPPWQSDHDSFRATKSRGDGPPTKCPRGTTSRTSRHFFEEIFASDENFQRADRTRLGGIALAVQTSRNIDRSAMHNLRCAQSVPRIGTSRTDRADRKNRQILGI